MPQALFHFVTHGARVLIDTKKSGRPILARYKHFTTIRAHTTESSPIVSLSSGGIKCSSMHGVAICWREDTIFLMTRRKIFQRIVRHDLPYHSSKQWSFPMNVFFRLVVFVNLSCRISWTTRFWTELLVDQPLPSFACNPNTLDPSSFLSTSRHSQVGIAMPSLVKKNCFHSFFPTGGRLVGDHTSFFQEVPLDLQYHSNLLVFVVEVFWSKFQDIRLSAFVTIWEHRSCWLECTLKLRHLFLQPYQEALRWCPRTLPLPSETQKHLALWMALCVLRLWRCHLRAQLAPCISGGVLQVRRSFSDKGPSDSRVQEDDFQRFLSKLMHSWIIFRGRWDLLKQCSRKNWWSVILLAISLLECCLGIGHPAVHVAQVTIAFHRSPTIFLVVRIARGRQLFHLSLWGRLFLPLRSLLSDEVCLCHDSNVNLGKLS